MKQLIRTISPILLCCVISFPQGKDETVPHKTPFALSVSGGTSLGAYEAGYCYYFAEWLKKNGALFDLKVVTGTSAGSINALITFLSMADSTPSPVPQNSAFFKAWSDVDFNCIRGPDTRLGLFGRKGTRHIFDVFIPEIEKSANAYADRYLGITATHLTSYDQDVVSGLAIPTIKQQFVVRGTTDSAGAWTFVNYINPGSRLAAAVLPFKAGDAGGNNAILGDLALASTGIPGLFKPYKIRHLEVVPSKLTESGIRLADFTNDLYDSLLALKYNPKPGTKNVLKWVDPRRNYPFRKGIADDTVWFYVDGGILDNSPIRRARQIVDSAFPMQPADGGAPRRYRADMFRYLYLSPENILYPEMRMSNDRDSSSVFSTLGGALTDWTSAARQNELFTLKEENPDIARWLLLSRNYYPVYSRFLHEQFGFLERDLRVFDFYLGMYDARKFLFTNALDSMSEKTTVGIRSPIILDTSFDRISDVLDGKTPATYTDNLDRLAGLSRELYFWSLGPYPRGDRPAAPVRQGIRRRGKRPVSRRCRQDLG